MVDERILLVVTPSVSSEQVEAELDGSRIDDADVMVVVPSIAKSAMSYWFSDEGNIREARSKAGRIASFTQPRAAHVSAVAGDADPSLAVSDALAAFPADRVIVVHRADCPGYREDRLNRIGQIASGRVEDHLVRAA